MKKITVTANSVSEALAQVQKEYGVREDEYSYKVIEKGFKGIFGLMSKEAIVEVTLKEGFFKRKLEEFLRSILDNFGEIQVRIRYSGKKFIVNLEGKDMGRLIGKHGRTLAAVQHIAALYLNRLSDTKLVVVMDAGSYREKRKKSIESIVASAISKVKNEKGRVILDPMFSFERRMVHELVKKHRNIKSYSVGTEPYRRVVIEYVSRGRGARVS